ncbi:MAG: dTDP-4-dehydrorhamnose 3,5-epimerase [Actinomycetota bacterium]|nr:dTDP-4-dehydrorhamnose 3,5-epimerase [Actinomycetota bacterium]
MLEGPLLLAPHVHGDERGFFLESYRERTLHELGVDYRWVQDNHSRSARGIVRGMHFQSGQAKLVRCARGEVLDVLVDIRRGSPQFGHSEAFRLDDVEHHQLYVPDGFAHGFCVISEVADVAYKASAYYDPQGEGGFAFDDPEVAIEWPSELDLVASERDRSAPRLSELAKSLPFEYERPA